MSIIRLIRPSCGRDRSRGLLPRRLRRLGLEQLERRCVLSAAAPAATHIVVFKDGTDVGSAAADLANAHGLGIEHEFRHALRGMSVVVPEGRLNALQHDPRVAYVEPNQAVHALAQTVPTGVQRIFADTNPNITIDGHDDRRIDVDVAVIDTGIDLDHSDLNVVASTNCSGGGPFKQSCGSGGDDDNGHGTHVAGTIGALDNGLGVVGVAPGARLHAVKVLNSSGSGYVSWIVAGIDWVTARASQIEVANMSLGFEGSSSALNTAMSNSVAAGVVYAVAAGNSDKNASTFSPANHPDVITVSALADFNGEPGGGAATTCRLDQDDTLADFSNWGNTVEVAAPGVCITSTWLGGGYNTISGTSMASPHVAGAAALLASKNNPGNKTDVLNLRQTIVNTGNLNWTDDSGDGVKERLLDVSNTTAFAPTTVAGSETPADTTPPDPPASLSVTPNDGHDGVLDLDWNDNVEPDLAGYNVYRSTISGGSYTKLNTSLVTVSAYQDMGLVDGDEFYYVVTAVDSSGNESAQSLEASGTVLNTVAPATPANLTAAAGDQQVTLDWPDNSEADLAGYNVLRSTTSGGPYANLASVTDSAFTDTGLTNGVTYYYVVTAVDNSTNESAFSNEASATPDASASAMHVGDLDGAAQIKGKSGKWEAFVTVTIHDSSHNAVANATVSATWSGARSGATSGITDQNGNVTFATGAMSSGDSVILTIDNVTQASHTYTAVNHDPDGDSNGTSITVSKPSGAAGKIASQGDDVLLVIPAVNGPSVSAANWEPSSLALEPLPPAGDPEESPFAASPIRPEDDAEGVSALFDALSAQAVDHALADDWSEDALLDEQLLAVLA